MNKSTFLFVVGLIVIIVILAGNPFYILPEGRQAIITQFGKPIGIFETKAGLKIKIPFIQKVNYFDERLLEWDGYPTQIPTKDKKYIWVDTTARWKISDPLKFFQSVNNERGAQARLDDIIDSAVRDVATAHDLIDIVRSSNRMIKELEALREREEFIEEGVIEAITVGREKIRRDILSRAKELAPRYGIELVDVRIKRVNYIEDVEKKVYERMIAERKRAAEMYRSEGRGIRAEIEGKTEKELKIILSDAYRKAQIVKGEADAQSTQIYAEAYNKDRELYAFLKTLESYKDTVDEKTTIIITTDSDYFKYLKEITPRN